jgi:hypothetical protein
MIYLILTTSIVNRIESSENREEREKQYIDSISHTLSLLPNSIKPIIVENNGKRSTYLDHFQHNYIVVPVLYTNNNDKIFKNKGVNEILDIKDVIKEFGIKEDDMIIKLTGRYKVISPLFFEKVIKYEKEKDAFIKFFSSESLSYKENDCILGMYAMRCLYFQLFNEKWLNNYDCPEEAFAKYIRYSILHIDEIKQLDLECVFSQNKRILNV